MAIKITCITKYQSWECKSDWKPCESIKSVGGKNVDGSKWTKLVSDVVKSIEDDKKDYYVEVDGKRADVKVVSREGKKYIRTEKDDTTKDNLLSLESC